MAALLGGRRGGWTGGRPPRRCTSGFVGASVFVRRTNGERTRRWALERRKIHISSTALVSQRPPAHFPRRRSRAPRSAAAACPRPPRRLRRARRAPQRLASSSLGWRWAGVGTRVTAAARLPAPRPAPRGRPSLRTGLDGCIGQGGSRMLGTVKMEGHESSDWNSYYADTQEVRGGQQAGRSRNPFRRRPGEAGARQDGRLAGWGRFLHAIAACPPEVFPDRPWPGLGAGSGVPRGRLGPGGARRLERARGF